MRAPKRERLLRARAQYYERHVLAWYALGRGHEAREAWAAVCELRRRTADMGARPDVPDSWPRRVSRRA